MKPKVSAIILHWNHFNLLKDTIESIKEQDYENKEIIIVDNASTDGSQSLIKQYYSDCILIENDENYGWAKGNNIGIEYSLKNGADYVLLCNNDILLKDNDVITKLVSTVEDNIEYNVLLAGGVVYYSNSLPEKIHNCGYIFYPESEKKGKYFNKFRIQNDINLPENLKIVDFVSGCFMLIKKDVFSVTGLMDDLFFLYSEEASFSFSAWKSNIVSVINMDIKIYHKIASSIEENSPASIYYQYRNIYYLMKKHKSDILFRKYFIRKYYLDLIRYVIKMLISINTNKRFESVWCALKGYIDAAILKKMGKKT